MKLLELGRKSNFLTKEAVIPGGGRIMSAGRRGVRSLQYHIAKAQQAAPKVPQGIPVGRSAGQEMKLQEALAGTAIKRPPPLPGSHFTADPARQALSNRMIEEPLISAVRSAPAAATKVEQAAKPLTQIAEPLTQVGKAAPTAKPERDIVTSLLNRKKELAVGTTLGGGGAYGGSTLVGNEKAASLVGAGLMGAKALGKATLGGPLRRKITGTGLLVGGMGAHGASKGHAAQWGIPLNKVL